MPSPWEVVRGYVKEAASKARGGVICINFSKVVKWAKRAGIPSDYENSLRALFPRIIAEEYGEAIVSVKKAKGKASTFILNVNTLRKILTREEV